MWVDDNPAVTEVDQQLAVLDHNLRELQAAAERLARDTGDPAYMSLAQAFSFELEEVSAAQQSSPNDREAALTHVLSDISTIRAEADPEIVERLDTEVEEFLRSW